MQRMEEVGEGQTPSTIANISSSFLSVIIVLLCREAFVIFSGYIHS
jgi:hypothetical protein